MIAASHWALFFSHRAISSRAIEYADLTRTVESRQATEDNTDGRIADLYTAIYKLNPLEKALITLFLEDFTYEQMAEATGISANNVGVMTAVECARKIGA